MRSAVNVLALTVAICGAVLFASAPARAIGPRTNGDARWVPSLAIRGGALIGDQKASVASACAKGGPGVPEIVIPPCSFFSTPPEAPNFLRPAENGSELGLSPLVGFDFELMTPTLEALPGRPRFFVRGGVNLIFPPSRDVAKEADPTSISSPRDKPFDALPAAALNGKGSKVAATLQTLGYGAGIGVAFPFEFRGRRLWVKPSAGWTRWSVDLNGKVVQGLKNDPDPRIIANVFSPFVREVNLLKTVSQSFNGIGPGIDLELEAGRFGPIGVNVFAGGAAYRVIDDRDVAWSAVRELTGNDLPDDTATANFTYKVSPWMYRVGLGIRFQWLGRR